MSSVLQKDAKCTCIQVLYKRYVLHDCFKYNNLVVPELTAVSYSTCIDIVKSLSEAADSSREDLNLVMHFEICYKERW